MKKALSLLASLGLVATSSMAVVSCTKQDNTPDYRNWDSLKGHDLLNTNEALPISLLDSGTPAAQDATSPNLDELVFGTLAGKFKNPVHVLEDIKQQKLAVKVVGRIPESEIMSDSKEIVSATYVISIGHSDGKGMDDILLQVKGTKQSILTPNNVTPIDFTKVVNGIQIYRNQLLTTFNGIRSDLLANKSVKDYQTIEASSSRLASLDSWLLNTAVQFQDATPGLNKDGIRYYSVAQQIKDSFNNDKDKSAFLTFNTNLVGHIQNDIDSKASKWKEGIGYGEETINDFYKVSLTGSIGEGDYGKIFGGAK